MGRLHTCLPTRPSQRLRPLSSTRPVLAPPLAFMDRAVRQAQDRVVRWPLGGLIGKPSQLTTRRLPASQYWCAESVLQELPALYSGESPSRRGGGICPRPWIGSCGSVYLPETASPAHLRGPLHRRAGITVSSLPRQEGVCCGTRHSSRQKCVRPTLSWQT